MALQKEKIQELGIKPKPVIIDAMLVKIAERNNLTLAQLHSSDQFDSVSVSKYFIQSPLLF
jgi:hypothetical protein